MANESITNPAPQFGTAEYAGGSAAERCQSCKKPIGSGSQYYRVNGNLACAYCGEQARLRLPQDSHQAFVRGLLFGVGGAILGLIGYAAFGIITGLMIGYISLAVGWIVGKAMMKGSHGIGGRRYQIAAVLLTYAAVSMAAVPIGISQFIKHDKANKPGMTKLHSPGDAQAQHLAPADPNATVVTQAPSANEAVDANDAAATPANSSTQKPGKSFGAAIGMLALVGLASPFLELTDPLHGVIGLVILFVGIRIAWKLTEGVKLEILGPFTQTPKSDGAA
jgi:hypothetical protein